MHAYLWYVPTIIRLNISHKEADPIISINIDRLVLEELNSNNVFWDWNLKIFEKRSWR